MRTATAITGMVTALALLALGAAPLAGAKDGDVRVAGTCTKGSTSKLKLSAEDGGLEAEFEVDQNRVGVRWAVTMTRNGVRVFNGTRVTRSPSGSFEIRRATSDATGPERVTATAKSPTGETCTARATWA